MGNYGKLSGMATIGGRSIRQKSSPSMARNLDGSGFGWKTDKWEQLRRFLILGSSSPTYYASASSLTKTNVKALLECLREDYRRYVDAVVKVRKEGLSPKQDAAIFAFALIYVHGTPSAKAYASKYISSVCRTASNLQEWVVTLTGTKESGAKSGFMRGWGRSVRTATGIWITERQLQNLVYQAIKYRSRAGTSMRNVVRLAHPNPGDDEALSAVLYWISRGEMKDSFDYRADARTVQIWAFERAKRSRSSAELVELISKYGLPWEAIPTEMLNDLDVLAALVEGMPINATVRQLPRITSVGLLRGRSNTRSTIIDRLSSEGIIKSDNIHPMKLLQATILYAEGRGSGKLTWTPDAGVNQALERAFYMSFGNVLPSGKNRMIAIDVSGSMEGAMYGSRDRFNSRPYFKNCSGLFGVTPREAAAALAMITMRTEPWYYIVGFSRGLTKLELRPEMTLHQVIEAMRRVPAGSTNIAAPMVQAADSNLPVDLFEVYTDNEGNTGMHPAAALSRYKNATGKDARAAFVAMVGYDDSVADPNRSDMMDFIGLDPTTPVMLNRFATGELLG